MFVVYVCNYQIHLIVYDLKTPPSQIKCSHDPETRSLKCVTKSTQLLLGSPLPGSLA